MGCSSSKLDHLEDSIHVMLSRDTRTKTSTIIVYREDLLRKEPSATTFDCTLENLEEDTKTTSSIEHMVLIYPS